MKKNPYGTVIWLGVILLMLTSIFYIVRPNFYANCETYTDATTGKTFTRCCNASDNHQSCFNAPGQVGQHTIAIEFSKTAEGAHKVLDDVNLCHLDEIRREVYIDFIFIAFYTAFLLVFVFTTSRIMRRDPIMLIGFLPLVGMAADITENIYFLSVLDSFALEQFANLGDQAFKMYIFTLIKWFTLAFTFLLIGTVLFRGNAWYKFVAVMLIIPLALGVGYFFYEPLEFWFFISSIAAFFWLFLVACTFRGHKSSRGVYV